MLQMAFLVLFAFVNPSSKDLSYETAFAKAEKENKPLVILVGAEWCAACKTMKSTTIERMKEGGGLKEVVFTMVDKDARPDLASRVMLGDTLPQIVVFSKNESGWKRFSLAGIQSENRVKELIGRATGAPVATGMDR